MRSTLAATLVTADSSKGRRSTSLVRRVRVPARTAIDGYLAVLDMGTDEGIDQQNAEVSIKLRGKYKSLIE
jgi:hypothetical protein